MWNTCKKTLIFKKIAPEGSVDYNVLKFLIKKPNYINENFGSLEELAKFIFHVKDDQKADFLKFLLKNGLSENAEIAGNNVKDFIAICVKTFM